jgi:hypothetical protein
MVVEILWDSPRESRRKTKTPQRKSSRSRLELIDGGDLIGPIDMSKTYHMGLLPIG